MSLTPRRTFGPPGSDSGVGFYTLNDMFVPGSLNFVQVSINWGDVRRSRGQAGSQWARGAIVPVPKREGVFLIHSRCF